jgi:sugar phosphate isomerase/epimerase
MTNRSRIDHAVSLCFVAWLLVFGVLSAKAAEPAKQGPPNPFFALSNCSQCEKYATPEAQARVLEELGYAGIGPSGTNGIPEMLEALDKHGLKMVALYVGANLDPDKPKYDPKLPEVIRELEGRDTFIWLYVLSGKFKPSSTDGDSQAVALVREIAEMAEQSGLRVALYPHAGFYVQRVEDAVRVAEKVDRENVGVTFNLCHWLKLDEPSSMKRLVELARPHLFLVTINGADHDGESWDRLIQPLDRGSFDVYGFLKMLKELGYTGPIGLQCYGVPGDKYENLKRSIDAWRKLSERLAGAQN